MSKYEKLIIKSYTYLRRPKLFLACILIASVWTNRDRELKNWFAELAVDFEKVNAYSIYRIHLEALFLILSVASH